MDCHEKEDHDGQRTIDEEEFKRFVERSKKGEVNLSCSKCNVKVEDEDGNVVFSHCKLD